MNTRMRSVEEQGWRPLAKESGPTVFLISWIGDGPFVKASYGDVIIDRRIDENEDEFQDRVGAEVRAVRCNQSVRVVFLDRENEAVELPRMQA